MSDEYDIKNYLVSLYYLGLNNKKQTNYKDKHFDTMDKDTFY